MFYCKKCGAEIHDGERFCYKCGATVVESERMSVPFCPKCGAAIIKRKSKKGAKRVFYGCERYPDCDFVSWDKPVEMKCPRCGGLMVQKSGRNGSYIACTDKACGYIHRAAKKEKTDE